MKQKEKINHVVKCLNYLQKVEQAGDEVTTDQEKDQFFGPAMVKFLEEMAPYVNKEIQPFFENGKELIESFIQDKDSGRNAEKNIMKGLAMIKILEQIQKFNDYPVDKEVAFSVLDKGQFTHDDAINIQKQVLGITDE